MQSQRIEVQVLAIVDSVVGGGRVEDDRVELKREWPIEIGKTARRIAGHANAAAGEWILWIIGLDEKAHQVHEPADVEPADWWAQVSARFSEVAPDPKFHRIATRHGMVMAVWMDTGRTPYVVTTDGRGGAEREVPWRSGTAIRSARRSEILRSVIAEAAVPQLDPVFGWIRATQKPETPADPESETPARVHPIEVTYFVRAYTEAREAVQLPEHRWAVTLSWGEQAMQLPDPDITGPKEYVGMTQDRFLRQAIFEPVGSILYVVNSGLHVNGSDIINISGNVCVSEDLESVRSMFRKARRLALSVRLPMALSEREAAFEAALHRSHPTQLKPLSASPQHRHVDDRLGEFTFGGATPDAYHGRSEPVAR